MMHAAAVIALGVALFGAAPRAALAKPRVGVVVRAVDAPPNGVGDVGRAISDAAAQAGSVPIASPVDEARARRAAGAVSRERLEVFTRAREVVNEGWKAYLAVEPEFAMERLGAARQTVETVIELDGALELLADASLRLGAVRQHLGRTAEARAAFALAAALDPGREIGDEFAPVVVEEYRRARAGGAAKATLAVTAPAGATIELDGAPVGSAPLRREVAVGEHVVVARAPGKLAAGQIVKLPPEGASIEIPLDDDVVGRALAPGEAGVAIGGAPSALFSAIAVYAELDEISVVIATWQAGAPALVGQRCTAPPVSCGAVIEVRYPTPDALGAAARELWESLEGTKVEGERGVTALRDPRVRNPDRRGGRPPIGERWYESPWTWVGVGAAAAAVVGAILIFGGGSDGGFAIGVPPCTFCPP